MNKFLIYFFLCLVLATFPFVYSIYSQETKTEEDILSTEKKAHPEVETYVNKEKKYVIQYPSSWQTRPKTENFDLILVAPPIGAETHVSATMNMLSEFVGPSLTLDQFFDENIPNITTELKEAKVEATGAQIINGAPLKWALYTHTMNNLKLRVLQYFIIANETAYLITFSSIADDFNFYKNQFEAIAQSFHLLVSPPDASIKPQTNSQPKVKD